MNTKTTLGILSLVIVAIAGGVYMKSNGAPEQGASVATVPEAAPVAQTAETAPEAATAPVSTYKDGTYSATGAYKSPAGEETIDVSLTLKDGIIVDSTVKGNGTNPGTKANQADFVGHYKEMVTGKSIDEANLTKVSGSSLTGAGWNAAIEKIKSEAKA